jgi:hypothetical protein
LNRDSYVELKFGPRLFGNKVASGNGRISRTIPTRDHPTERAVGPARLRIRIQYSADEILSLCSDIGMAWMWNAHPKKLECMKSFAQRSATARTTKLYDRRGQKVLLEDMERVRY